nr:MAG: hypothetical protein 2 [Betanecrovirus sp.]
MENQQQQYQQESRGRSVERRKEGIIGSKAGTQAIAREAGVKENSAPAVSMTVVGEQVTFTQHFHF